ncbi:MAG: 50S ribosomal protein L11 methyltransferase [Aureispira sp.]|nr:50S ribosomal protein L11 methyltransferase [Aureispira sp.]
MQYIKLDFKVSNNNTQELILGQLSNYDSINGFEQTDNQLLAYIAQTDYNDNIQSEVASIAQQFDCSYQTSILDDKNWNAQWESDYTPVLVEDFCAIRASFHPAHTQFPHEIIITPKMSFGTGHHETTYMMVQQMREQSFEGKHIFDYGCGTGILAILAEKLGAKKVYGIDIDVWAYENAIENLELNQCNNISIDCGTLEQANLAPPYDIVLANINRNVILASFSALKTEISPNGVLLTSGFLKQDEELVLKEALAHKFHPLKTLHKGKWLCIAFQYRP